MEKCHAHGGTEFFIGSCISSKYMNQGKLSGSSFHQKSLPYQPNHFSLTIHSGSHGLRPLVSKIIPDFARFFNDFFLYWKSEHTFWLSHMSTKVLFSRLQKDTSRSKGLDVHLAAYPLAWPRSLLHVLWLDQVQVLFFFFFYYYFFLFPSFWDFRPSWSFLTSWIRPSFVKAYDLSLPFMEWVFLWNFGP